MHLQESIILNNCGGSLGKSMSQAAETTWNIDLGESPVHCTGRSLSQWEMPLLLWQMSTPYCTSLPHHDVVLAAGTSWLRLTAPYCWC